MLILLVSPVVIRGQNAPTPPSKVALERETAEFQGLRISYPPELKAAVERVGPEYAQVLKKARGAMEAYCRKQPVPSFAEVADEDLMAFRAYGLEPDVKLLDEFVVLLGAMQDGAQIARWFVSGDRMQIWIKEDMVALLKAGGTVPDFTLAPDGVGVRWNVRFSLLGKDLHATRLTAGRAGALEEAMRRIDAMPRPEYPMVLPGSTLSGKLEDPAELATAIRAGEGSLFGMMRAAEENPEMTAKAIASSVPRFGKEHGWFLVVHEVAEAAIMGSVIRSSDRRWFCDGLANWIAIQDVDRRYGKGKGAETFTRNYDAAEMRKHAAEVKLLAWPTAEDVDKGRRPEVEHPLAYYYFATLVIEKACAGRGAGFIKTWLDEIRQTPLNRANTGTVLAAFRKLTGSDLKEIIDEVVR